MVTETEIRAKYQLLGPTMKERSRRLWAGSSSTDVHIPSFDDVDDAEVVAADAAEAVAIKAADRRLEAAKHGNTRHDEALDTEPTQVVSSEVLGDTRQGSFALVGRDGVWWPHWSSKPVAGR